MAEKLLAKEGAISCGINLDVECAWIGPPDNDGFTPFGPDANRDNIFQNIPQVNLHDMDEGLTLKMCVSILNAAIKEAIALHKMNITSVSDKNVLCCRMNVSFDLCIDVCFDLCFYVCFDLCYMYVMIYV